MSFVNDEAIMHYYLLSCLYSSLEKNKETGISPHFIVVFNSDSSRPGPDESRERWRGSGPEACSAAALPRLSAGEAAWRRHRRVLATRRSVPEGAGDQISGER